MKSESYKVKIKAACEQAGTYKPCFDDVIATLADILEQRDSVYKDFEKSGGHAIITHTNKAGAPNPDKNPLLVMWNSFNVTALAYWKDLGLTPAGLRRINDDLVKPTKRNKLAEALNEISKELS